MSRRGFTLVEMLVTIALLAVVGMGIMGALSALANTDARVRRVEMLQRLAMTKLSTIGMVATSTPTDDKGDFTDQGFANVSWTVKVEATSATDIVRVYVTASLGGDSRTLNQLVFVRPTTSTTGSASR